MKAAKIDSPAHALPQVQALESRRLLSGSPLSTPFTGVPIPVGQPIEAENFDLGGEGIAYHMTRDLKLNGASYRPSDAVSVQSGGSNGYDVGHATAGQWMQYAVSIPATANYSLKAMVANTAAGGVFHANVDSVNCTLAMSVPSTGGGQTYTTLSSKSFLLGSGTHVLRVCLDTAASNSVVGNFDSFQLVPAVSAMKIIWRSVAPIPQGITEGAGETVNGKLYVFSGFTDTRYYPSSRVYCYDPATDIWTRLGDMPVPVTHTGTAVDGKYIYVAGGYPPNAKHTYQLFATTNVWRYDTTTDSWAAMPGLPQARGAGNVALLGNSLYYFSGDDITRAYDRHEQWVLNLDNLSAGWTATAPIPTARNRLGAVALNGVLYAIGGAVGQDAKETAQSVVEMYSPATGNWSTVAPMPTPRALVMSACTVYNGQIIVAGGETAFGIATNQVTAYNPNTNTWTQLTPLPLKRIGGILKSLGGQLIFTTGHPGFNANTWIGTFG